MSMPVIEITQLLAYDGPNVFGPQPGVLLRARCDRDRSRRLKAALKDGAQSIGLVIAYLEVTIAADTDGVDICATFATPMPQIGKELAAYIVAGIAAEAIGDEEWDRDAPLLEMQQRRRQAALPVATVQLLAEARRRNVPVLRRADNRIQFGYGVRSWDFDPFQIANEAPPATPWDNLGYIPIYAVTGERRRTEIVQQATALLQQRGIANIRALPDADYDATRNLLADPAVEAAVIGLQSVDILRRGLAFDRCTQSIIADRDGERPAEARDDVEWTRALGVPMLVSSRPAIFDRDDPALAALVAYAPYGIAATNGLEHLADPYR